MDVIGEDIAKDAAEDAEKGLGEITAKELEGSFTKALESLGDQVTRAAENPNVFGNLVKEGAEGEAKTQAENLIKEQVNLVKGNVHSVIEDAAKQDSEKITEALETSKKDLAEANEKIASLEGKAAEDAKKAALEAQKASASAIKEIGEGFAKKSSLILKLSLFGAFAYLMLGNYIKKNGKTWNVKSITINGDIYRFTIDNDDPSITFDTADTFTFSSDFINGNGLILNGISVTVGQQDSESSTVLSFKKNNPGFTNSGTLTTENPVNVGSVKCSSDLKKSLANSTGESLDDIIDAAAKSADDLADDLGLGGIFDKLKWVLIIGLSIFGVLIILWLVVKFWPSKK